MTNREAEAALWLALNRYIAASGEPQWTNGYRCAAIRYGSIPNDEEQRLFDKEMVQWKRADTAGVQVTRTIRRVIAALRKQAVSKDGAARKPGRGRTVRARKSKKAAK
jgi:hypothetical protein